MDPDEAHYAQLTREMLRAGNWMIPLLDGLPYIDKPVLFHWLQGLAIAMLGETETAMRLPSAIAAVGLFLLTRWTGTQLLDGRIGVRAWLMLATLPLTFLLGSIGVFDMVFTAFLFGAIAFALVAALRNRPRLQYVAYVFLSLAVMTKGPVALALAGAFFLAGLACGRECRTALLSLRWVTGALLDRAVVAAVVRVDVLRAGLALRAAIRACRQHLLRHPAAVVLEPRVQSHVVCVDVLCRLFSVEHRRARRRARHDSPMALGDQDSARRNSSVGMGRRGLRILQRGALQGRSLRLSGRARVLPARSAGVDEPQRIPARSRGLAR